MTERIWMRNLVGIYHILGNISTVDGTSVWQYVKAGSLAQLSRESAVNDSIIWTSCEGDSIFLRLFRFRIRKPIRNIR